MAVKSLRLIEADTNPIKLPAIFITHPLTSAIVGHKQDNKTFPYFIPKI